MLLWSLAVPLSAETHDYFLQGIGAATASAMLTVYSPSLPFMSDEALAAAVPGRPEYTVKKYIQLVEALRDKAAALTSSSGQRNNKTAGIVLIFFVWPITDLQTDLVKCLAATAACSFHQVSVLLWGFCLFSLISACSSPACPQK